MPKEMFVRGSGWSGHDAQYYTCNVIYIAHASYTNIPQGIPGGFKPALSTLLRELVWDAHGVQRNSTRTRLLGVHKYRSYIYGVECFPVDWTHSQLLKNMASLLSTGVVGCAISVGDRLEKRRIVSFYFQSRSCRFKSPSQTFFCAVLRSSLASAQRHPYGHIVQCTWLIITYS